MNKILKNFYCDYVLFFINISFIDKFWFLFLKYFYFIFLIFRIKIPLKLFGKSYNPNDSYGLLGFQVMLKDFYQYYYIAGIKNPVIFDVGANVGNFSLAASIFYKKSRIYAFEPIKKTYDLLSSNLSTYSNIKSYNLALGDVDGINKMYFSEKALDRSSFSKKNINEKDIDFENVKVSRLETFLKENKIDQIDILKIDVEGFELDVLRGGLNCFDKIDNIIIEIHVDNNPDNLVSVFDLMISSGFKFFWIGKIWQGSNSGKKLECFDVIFKKC